jgi:hypothetical protein
MAAVTGLAVERAQRASAHVRVRVRDLHGTLDDGLCEPAAVEAACNGARCAFGEFIGDLGRAAHG